MSDYSKLMEELLEENDELKKEVELIAFKYELIKKLIQYRKAKKLTQKGFADKIGVKQQMISRFEKGNVDPRLSFVSKVINGMNHELCLNDKDYVMVANLQDLKMKKPSRIAEKSYKANNNIAIAV